MRSTRAHFIKTVAAKVSADEEKSLEGASEYEIMLHQLNTDRRTLKQIQSQQAKAEYKKKILPEYFPWIEGVIAKGAGKQDNVLMYWLVWSIDCQEYELALKIAKYAIFHELALPEKFKRTVGTLVVEEFADKAKAARETNIEFSIEVLTEVEQLTKGVDMPDQSKARLVKELAFLNVEEKPIEAISYFEQALTLDPHIGVRKDLERLRKRVEKETNVTA